MTIRPVVKGAQRGLTSVVTLDEKGQGGAYHEYLVKDTATDAPLSSIVFQDGPVKVKMVDGVEEENSVNGIFMEDLISICIDRLECFQEGPYACETNAQALVKLQESLMWLNKRSQDRENRGVLGTYVK